MNYADKLMGKCVSIKSPKEFIKEVEKMKNYYAGVRLFLGAFLLAILVACGGGDGSSGGSGTVSMNITDAKPALPEEGIESVTIKFDEVSVHKSGGGWTTLPVETSPLPSEIDLYRFREGSTTQFVPPVGLECGKYTQVRIGVTSGIIRINGVDHNLGIPSTNLKTDKNFEFDVPCGGAVNITVDFDLSQSIVLTGTGVYQLKPVLHINETSKAAAVQGEINFDTAAAQATVVVYWDKNGNGTLEDPDPMNFDTTDEEYTRILVEEEDSVTFKVFWLVPEKGYIVQVLLGDSQSPDRSYVEYVEPSKLGEGAVYDLNEGKPI
jgi:hypothetical protein